MTIKAISLRRLPVWPFFAGAAFLILLWLGIKGWRINQATQSLLSRQEAIEALLADGPMSMNPAAAETLMLAIRQDVLVLKTEAKPFLPVTPYLGWVPKAGPLLAVAPQLLELADAGTETAVLGWSGLQPALILMQNETGTTTDLLPQLMVIISDAEIALRQADIAFERVISARTELGDTSLLPWRVQTLLAQIDPLLAAGSGGLKLAPILPELLGQNGQRRYLLLIQNEDELRATGGYISGAGLLVVENGRILDLTFQDAYQIDNYLDLPYAFPPQPLYDFMGSEMFFFRDANFWPDFPTSAQKAMDLYSYGQQTAVFDGAIAVDQRFLQLLLQAIGPVIITEANVTLNANNVQESLRTAWALDEDETVSSWIGSRKEFLGTFGNAIRQRMEGDLANLDLINLAKTMITALETKHLQIYLREPQAAFAISALNGDGRLTPESGQDYLMVVDSNIGFNKVNLLVSREMAYAVDLKTQTAHLTLDYTHSGTDTGEPCFQGVNYNASAVSDYMNLANLCYFNYLRIYTPEGSRLLDSSRHFVPGDILVIKNDWDSTAQIEQELPGTVTFANFLLLPRSQQLQASFTYQLPTVTTEVNGQTRYQLQIQKQAGLAAQPISVKIALPPGSQLKQSNPVPSSQNGDLVQFDLYLEKDTVIVIEYD